MLTRLRGALAGSNFLRDAGSSLGFKIGLMVLSFVQGIILARVLKPEGRGILALYLAPLNMVLPFVNLGVRQASSYYLAKHNWALPRVVGVHVTTALVSALLGALIIGGIYWHEGLHQTKWVVLLLLALPFKIFVNSSFGIAMARRMIRTINVSQLLRAGLEFVLVVMLILVLRGGEDRYFWLYFVSEVLVCAYVLTWLVRIEGYRFEAAPSLARDIGPVVRKGLTYAIPLYFVNIFYNIDILFLNRYVGADQIGHYQVGMSFSLLLWQLPTFLSFVVFSYSVSAEDEVGFSRSLWRNTRRVMLASLAALIVIVPAGRWLIPLLYGQEYVASYDVFLRLLPGVYLMIFYKMLNGDLAGRGRPLINFWVILPMLVLKVVLNAAFVPDHGVSAAALISGLCYSLVAGVYVIVYHRLCLRTGGGIGPGGRQDD